MTEKLTFTPEEVNAMIESERLKERMISFVLTALQRAKQNGDDPVYINAGNYILNSIIGAAPEPQAPPETKDKKPEENN